MHLIKIGGAVFKNIDGFTKLIEIIQYHSKKPLIIVISAFANATRTLIQAAKTAELGKLNQAKNIINKLINEHKELAQKLIKEPDVFESLTYLFDNSKDRISDLLKGISITNELTPKTLDNIMSYGEFFALHTIYHFLLEKNFNIHSVDSTSLIISDDNYGNAKPLIEPTSLAIKTKLKPLLKKDNIILTQGFVAKNKLGELTTMGIESSNLTAVLLSNILGINEITYWTDVEGIRTADPKIINDTLPIKHLSYKMAYSLSVNGLKLIYPEMIEHTEKNNIKLIFKSAFNPNGDFTVIYNNTNKLNHHIILLKTNLIYYQIEFQNDKQKFLLKDIINESPYKKNILSYKFQEDLATILSPDNAPLSPYFFNNFKHFSKYSVAQISIFDNDTTTTLNDIIDIIKTNKKSILDISINSKSLKIISLLDNCNLILSNIHKKLVKKN